MKKINVFLIVSLVVVLFSACSKEIDDRDQFIGTWKGSGTMNVSSLDINEISSGTMIIKKSESNDSQIIFSDPDDASTTIKASVNGNAYTYEDFTIILNENDATIVFEITGGGSINGSVITEQGTVSVNYGGETHTGTITGTYNKQ